MAKLNRGKLWEPLVFAEFKTKAALLLVLWLAAGVYGYNEFLEPKSIVTQILFMVITLLLAWPNRKALKPFFANPFRQRRMAHPYTNILWVYPFLVLLGSALIMITMTATGLVPADPQKIDEMSLTETEYIRELALLPLVVFSEEVGNVVVLLLYAKWFSKIAKRIWPLLVIILTSVFFGALHLSAGNMETAVSRSFIHLPFIFSILYFKTAWISILAHFYQNFLTYTSVLNPGFSADFVGYGLLLLALIIGHRHLLKTWETKREKRNWGRKRRSL